MQEITYVLTFSERQSIIKLRFDCICKHKATTKPQNVKGEFIRKLTYNLPPTPLNLSIKATIF